MALNIQTKISIDLGTVVSNSLSAVKAVRRSDQIRKEAEFQRAIADGLSYDEQTAMREAQLEGERNSSFVDAEYVQDLEKSIADTKKLSRFSKYRTKYADTLGQLNSGKINEQDYLSTLKDQMKNVTDPDLRLEIQNDISAAELKVKTYNDTILGNQIKKAQYDGTERLLDDAVGRVKTARAKALINDNQDEVTAYDETLSALNSQLSGVRIQNAITDFQVKSSTRGTNPVEKLEFINKQVKGSDSDTAIKIGDRTYTSAQQFWSLERDSYLAGSSDVFGNFFDEFETHIQNYIGADAVKFGYPTQTALDASFATFNELRAKPEMTPFLNRLDITQASVMSKSVDTLAKTVIAVGTNNLTFKDADSTLQNIQKKYGVDVAGYRLQLDENLRNLAKGGVITQAEAIKDAPDVNVSLPKIDAVASKTPVVPGAVPPGTPVVPTVNPPASTPGGVPVTPPTATPPPAVPPNTPPINTPPTTPPANTPATPPVTTTPPVAVKPPVTPTTPAGYTGVSVVDYLKSQKQDSSFASRAKLASEKGIMNYRGEAKQNEELLKLLRG